MVLKIKLQRGVRIEVNLQKRVRTSISCFISVIVLLVEYKNIFVEYISVIVLLVEYKNILVEYKHTGFHCYLSPPFRFQWAHLHY